MYGSIMRARLKPGRKQEYLRFVEELMPSTDDYGRGLQSVEIAFEDKDPDRIAVIIHFKDKDSYIANAERSETDADFRRQAEFFDGDVEWIDVNYERYIGKPIAEEAGARH